MIRPQTETKRIRGSRHPALLFRYARWKVVAVALLAVPLPLIFPVMLVDALSLGRLPAGDHVFAFVVFGLASVAAIELIARAVGPNEIALLDTGLLLSRGLSRRFVPWSAVAGVAHDATISDHDVEFGDDLGGGVVRVRIPDMRAVESNWHARLWAWGETHLTIPLGGLKGDPNLVVTSIREAWWDPSMVAAGAPRATAAELSARHVVANALERVAVGDAEFAIFYANRAANRYVQMGRDEEDQIRLEAVSNAYLTDEQLGPQEIQRLGELGWVPPAAEISNFRVALSSPVEWREASRLVLQTLVDVYGLPAEKNPSVKFG